MDSICLIEQVLLFPFEQTFLANMCNYDIHSTNYHRLFDAVALIRTLSTYIECGLEHETLLLSVYSVSFVNKNMNEKKNII